MLVVQGDDGKAGKVYGGCVWLKKKRQAGWNITASQTSG